MTPDDAARLKAAATEGPWLIRKTVNMTITGRIHQVCAPGDFPTSFVPAWDAPEPGGIDGTEEAKANAAFIAAAHDMADLIAKQDRELAELRATANALLDLHNGPANEKRADVFERLMSRLATAMEKQE